LALSSSPSQVVLAACEGARLDGDGIALAEAFVLSGAREVLAATRAVDDASTLRFVRALYRAKARAPRLAEALRATMAAAGADDGEAWRAFRVIVR
jgi:CHAT domain-containing protein